MHIEDMLEFVVNCITWRQDTLRGLFYPKQRPNFASQQIIWKLASSTIIWCQCAGIGRQLHPLKAEYMIKDLMRVWDHDFCFLLWVQVSSKAPSGPGWSSTSQNVPKEKYTRLEASVQYANHFPSLEGPRSLLERPRSAMRGLWREKKWTHGTIT